MDYNETFNLVVNNDALRILMAVAAERKYKITSFDVKTAFLYKEITEEIFVYPTEGFKYKNKICKLKKPIYRLKQAPVK